MGEPGPFRRTPADRPGHVVQRPSGLTVFVYLGGDDRVEAVEFGRPDEPDDTVTYDGLDLFATPADDLVDRLRRRVDVVDEDGGYSFVAPTLPLRLWRSVRPEGPDDPDGRFFEAVLVARSGYHG